MSRAPTSSKYRRPPNPGPPPLLGRVRIPCGYVLSVAWSGIRSRAVQIPENTTLILSAQFDRCRAHTLIIPDSVTTMQSYAFSRMTKVATLRLPSGPMKAMGSHIFVYGRGIQSLVIPEAWTSLNNYFCDQCTALTHVTLPTNGGFTELRVNVFSGCRELTEITIPASVMRIGRASFEASGLERVCFEGDVSNIHIGTLNDALTSAENGCPSPPPPSPPPPTPPPPALPPPSPPPPSPPPPSPPAACVRVSKLSEVKDYDKLDGGYFCYDLVLDKLDEDGKTCDDFYVLQKKTKNGKIEGYVNLCKETTRSASLNRCRAEYTGKPPCNDDDGSTKPGA